MNMRLSILAFATAIILSGCASGPQKVTVENAAVEKYQNVSADDVKKLLSEHQTKIDNENYAFYSPGYAKQLSDSLRTANNLSNKQIVGPELPTKLAEIDATFARAAEVKSQVTTQMSEEIRLQGVLKNIDAGKGYPKEFTSVNERITDLIKLIETGQKEKFEKEKSKTMAAINKLHVDSVRYNALHDADTLIVTLKTKNAEKLIPITYKAAQDAYKQADTVIQQNYLDDWTVTSGRKNAMFAANHAVAVLTAVEALPGRVKASVEQVILDEENNLLQITQALQIDDVRDRIASEQAKSIVALATQKLASATATNDSEKRLAELTQSLSGSEERVKELRNQLSAREKEIAMLKQQVEQLGSATPPPATNNGSDAVSNTSQTEPKEQTTVN